MEHPWRDEERLRELYWDKGMSQREIAEELGCYKDTVAKWMDRHNIETRSPSESSKLLKEEHMPNEYPWRDEERLREMYIDEEMGYRSIAQELGTTKETIQNWVDNFDFDTHNAEDYGEFGSDGGRPQVFSTRYVVYNGYTAYRGDSQGTIAPIHQLTVIAEGANPRKVFSNGRYHVHHKNGIKFDNRPSNLELLTREDHIKKHRKMLNQ